LPFIRCKVLYPDMQDRMIVEWYYDP